MEKTFTILIPRHDDEYFAMATAVVDAEKIPFPRDVLPAVIRAVSQWIYSTGEGREAWEQSSHDFNVGDLAGHDNTEALKQCLNEEGIKSLKIDIYKHDQANNWEYDTTLVDESRLED